MIAPPVPPRGRTETLNTPMTVAYTATQERRAKETAKRLNITLAELHRCALDYYLDALDATSEGDEK